jgi:hypothetical protein
MQGGPRFSGQQQQSHPIRSTLLGILIIMAIIHFIPDGGAGYKPVHRTHTQGDVTTEGDTQGLVLPPELNSNPDEIKTWTIRSHRGYNPSFGCWTLQLDRVTGPHDETTSDYCAQDKGDYDSHPDGSQYTTKGSWLDNLTTPHGNVSPPPLPDDNSSSDSPVINNT